MEAILDDGDIEVDDVALLECLVARYAMAHLMVDRGADRLRIGRVTRGRIVERCRNRVLHADHVIVAQAVEFGRGDAGLDEGFDVVEDFGSQAARHPHLLDLFRCFDDDAHYVYGCEWRGSWGREGLKAPAKD